MSHLRTERTEGLEKSSYLLCVLNYSFRGFIEPINQKTVVPAVRFMSCSK